MTIVAVYNIKGGVGKTSTAVNLADVASRSGHNTLLWDLDPQGAASFYLRVRPKVKGGSKGILSGKTKLAKAIQSSELEGLDVLPADFSYRKMDFVLDDLGKPKRQIARLLEPLADEYDTIVLDCPPGISKVTDAILGAATIALVPTIPTTLSMRTLATIIRYVKKKFPEGPRLMAFFCMMDKRRALHRDIYEQALARPHLFLRTAVPYASVVEQMGIRRLPVGRYAAASAAAKAYAALWAELSTSEAGDWSTPTVRDLIGAGE